MTLARRKRSLGQVMRSYFIILARTHTHTRVCASESQLRWGRVPAKKGANKKKKHSKKWVPFGTNGKKKKKSAKITNTCLYKHQHARVGFSWNFVNAPQNLLLLLMIVQILWIVKVLIFSLGTSRLCLVCILSILRNYSPDSIIRRTWKKMYFETWTFG